MAAPKVLLTVTLVTFAIFACCPGAVLSVVLRDVRVFTSPGGYPTDFPPPPVDEFNLLVSKAACAGFSSFFIQMRCFNVLGLAQYEALVPYLDKAIGPLTGPNPYRVPRKMRTLANKKRSICQAVFRTFIDSFGDDPRVTPQFVDAMRNASCVPESRALDNSPLGIGNRVGLIVAEYARNDGSNAEGLLPDHVVPGNLFADYTGYVPANTAYEFKNKNRWLPLRSQIARDISYVQQFIGAQACAMKPLSLANATAAYLKPPGRPYRFGTKENKVMVDRVLEYSRNLNNNDYAKVLAEYVNVPHPNMVNLWWGAAAQFKWTFDEQIMYSFGFYVAAFDATIVTCCWKRIYDTPRPISLIRYTNYYKNVTAYAGPKLGNIQMPAGDWKQYTSETGPEPEYPSGAVMAHATYAKFGSLLTGPQLGIKVVYPRGGSSFEPGVTPKTDIVMDFPTWDSIGRQAVEGRQFGGVHYKEGAEGGYDVGQIVGAAGYKWASALWSGKMPTV